MKKFLLYLLVAMLLSPVGFIAYRRMYPDLRRAVKASDATLVERALNNGADPNLCRPVPNIITGMGREAPMLCVAAANGDVEIVRLLIRHGANKDDSGNGGHTPLGVAARSQHREVVRVLCELGVDVQANRHGGGTALSESLLCQDFGTAEILVQHGALESKEGWPDFVAYELMRVVGGDCNVPALRFLIARGVDVNMRSLTFAPDVPAKNRKPATALSDVRRKIAFRQKSIDNLDYQINGPRKAQLQDRLAYESKKMAVLKEAEQVLLAAGATE